MTNNYFRQIFSIYTGHVYQYTGEIPENAEPLAHITGAISEVIGYPNKQISVVQLPNGTYIVHSFEEVENEQFVKLGNLNDPEPAPTLPETSNEGQEQSVEESSEQPGGGE
jgi:hypothetical protein